MQIILFNGPPNSGKDYISELVITKLKNTYNGGEMENTARFGTYREKMATPIKAAVAAMFRLDPTQYYQLFETEAKDEPQDVFFGKTPREVLIDLSESWAKVLFGPDVFGVDMARYLKSLDTNLLPKSSSVFITDCGFQMELDAFLEGLDEEHNVAVFTLERDGTSFKGDSREYVKEVDDKVKVFKHIFNDGDTDRAADEIFDLIVEAGFYEGVVDG